MAMLHHARATQCGSKPAAGDGLRSPWLHARGSCARTDGLLPLLAPAAGDGIRAMARAALSLRPSWPRPQACMAVAVAAHPCAYVAGAGRRRWLLLSNGRREEEKRRKKKMTGGAVRQ